MQLAMMKRFLSRPTRSRHFLNVCMHARQVLDLRHRTRGGRLVISVKGCLGDIGSRMLLTHSLACSAVLHVDGASDESILESGNLDQKEYGNNARRR